MREGIDNIHPIEVRDIRTTTERATIYAATSRINDRSRTVNGPLLTIELTAPRENIIGVKLTHFKGTKKKGPRFELVPDPAHTPVIQDGEDNLAFASGTLSATVDKRSNNWSIAFSRQDGPAEHFLTQTGLKNMGYMIDTKSGQPYMLDQLHLAVGELIYGLGERFTPYVKNGQVVEMWNEDGGTSSEIAYKNIPFYLSNRGYGVFVNTPGKVSYEIGSEKMSRVQFSIPGESLEYMIITGGTPKEVLKNYTGLTGKPALPPPWSFGLWLTTSFTTSYDEETVSSFIDGMAERDIPLRVFHFDCFWMKEYRWCDFTWDKEVFPDPPSMLKRLKAKGLTICLWINPYIAQKSSLFDEGMENGYLLRKPNGDVWQTDLWQAGMGIVDFTNPEACRWYRDRLERLLDMGADCFKTDFGERIPTDVVYHDGSDPKTMHNYYTYLYNKLVFELLEEKRGKGEAVLFARSATAGGQKFPVHWGGDCWAAYESMAETLRGGLSLAMSGFGFWSHDIGGFEKTATPDLYKRWCAFGLLSSHSRLHGSSSYRVPWNFDEEAVDVLRFFTKLKCALMPYLYGKAVEAHLEGIPLLRPMQLEFPDDPACGYPERQYMLGDALLAAPVFSDTGEVTYYLPEGSWFNILTGERTAGGQWRTEKHGYTSLPLLLRENTVLPIGSVDTVPDYDYTENPLFVLFDIADGSEIETPIPNGQGGPQDKPAARAVTSREGSTLTISTSGITPPWTVVLAGTTSVKAVKGGTLSEANPPNGKPAGGDKAGPSWGQFLQQLKQYGTCITSEEKQLTVGPLSI